MDLNPIIISPPAPHTHTHTVIFLHGRGDTADPFAKSLHYSPDSTGRTLQQAFPSFRWVFPRARKSRSVAFGDTISQWFDIHDVRDFSKHEELQAEGLKDSVSRIRQLLESEAALLGGRWHHIVLAGLSQGGATSVHTLLNLKIPQQGGQQQQPRLGAFLGFSCRMPFLGRSLADTRKVLGLEDVPDGNEVIRNTPMMLQHCVDDPLVLVQNGRALRDTLGNFGAQVAWIEYPDGGHWFNSPSGTDDVVKFLSQVLGIDGYQGVNPGLARANSDAMDLS